MGVVKGCLIEGVQSEAYLVLFRRFNAFMPWCFSVNILLVQILPFHLGPCVGQNRALHCEICNLPPKIVVPAPIRQSYDGDVLQTTSPSTILQEVSASYAIEGVNLDEGVAQDDEASWVETDDNEVDIENVPQQCCCCCS